MFLGKGEQGIAGHQGGHGRRPIGRPGGLETQGTRNEGHLLSLKTSVIDRKLLVFLQSFSNHPFSAFLWSKLSNPPTCSAKTRTKTCTKTCARGACAESPARGSPQSSPFGWTAKIFPVKESEDATNSWGPRSDPLEVIYGVFICTGS